MHARNSQFITQAREYFSVGIFRWYFRKLFSMYIMLIFKYIIHYNAIDVN